MARRRPVERWAAVLAILIAGETDMVGKLE